MFFGIAARRALYGEAGARAGLLLIAALLCGIATTRPVAANVVTDWNDEFLAITRQTSVNWVAGPPEVARDIAIMGNAMFDAVTNAGAAGVDPGIAASAAAYTALQSIYTDAAWQTPLTTQTGPSNVLPAFTLANSVVLPALRSFLTNALGFDPGACGGSPGSANCLSYAMGVSAGNAVVAKRATDGAVAAIQHGLLRNGVLPSYPPGVYRPLGGAGPSGRGEMFPTWGGVTPTGLSGAEMAAAKATISGPPDISSAAYAANLLRVQCQGTGTVLPTDIQSICVTRGLAPATAAQADQKARAALFWNDPGMTAQPPGHWLQIADSVLQSTGASLLRSAQLTALLGAGETDAGIAAWGIKYDVNLWRPITAITTDCTVTTAGGTTSRVSSWSSSFTTCDPAWLSLISTPPHPDYVAGHPAFSGAAATILADFFGADAVSFASTSDYYCNAGVAAFNSDGSLASCSQNGHTYVVGVAGDCAVLTNGIISNGSSLICPIVETFASFSDASSGENGSELSRVAGGIHNPFSVQDALTLGNAIGAMIAADAGLPDVVAEPSMLALWAGGLLPLAHLHRRRRSRR